MRALMGSAASVWSDWQAYAIDNAQRSILFWDTIRERGNAFIERNQQGLPPVLHFEYETVVDGRTLARGIDLWDQPRRPPPSPNCPLVNCQRGALLGCD